MNLIKNFQPFFNYILIFLRIYNVCCLSRPTYKAASSEKGSKAAPSVTEPSLFKITFLNSSTPCDAKKRDKSNYTEMAIVVK